MSDGKTFPRLVEVMQRLLAPDGCPWDREQTLETLAPFLVEETYEVLDALERGTADDHCEELGDLLMQVVFHAELRAAEGAFTIDDVVSGIVEKLVRRHPHVFGDAAAETADEVLVQWDEIKAAEKAERAESDEPAGALDGVPLALPALARAQKVSRRAARVGFDWPDVGGSFAKVREELVEVEEALEGGDEARIEHEIGDLLFAAVNLARKSGADAETALRRATARFTDRFGFIEESLRARGSTTDEATLDEMDALWEQAKQRT